MKQQIDNLGKVAVTVEEDYWNIKKDYDKLTIVERAGTGTTFISRKPVPAGTSILNRNYWIKFSKWSDIPYKITQKFGDSDELAISQKTLTNKFSEVETEIQEGDETLDQRLRVVEVHERITVDGGELEVATAEDLENPQTPRQEAAVPTVRAILDASDDEPHLNSEKRFVNSDNLAKMYGYYLDNPEFIYILVDDEYHIIFGIKTDGDVIFSCGVPSQIKEYVSEFIEMFHYEDSPEFIDVKLDAENKILEGIRNDGTKVIGSNLKVLRSLDINGAVLKNTDNPEFLSIELDSDEKVLGGRKADGIKFENVGFDFGGAILKGINDPEGRMEINIDSEKKIISYRKKEGTLVENVGIETNHLELTKQGMNEFQQALKDNGFNPGGTCDWSDYISNDGESPLEIAMPKCAHLNLLTDFNLVELNKAYRNGASKGVNYDIPIYVEFFDMQGNYFKKKAFISGQGRSTMNRNKKNIAIDFFDSDWDDDAFVIRFGDWVPQDSFHLKAYVNEAFNANGTWAYKIYDAMSKSWGIEYDYIYKRALLDMSQNTSVKAYGTEPSDNAKFEDTGAKCFPDGFPVIIYQNGEFWGVFAWQIKKHRDNYKMKKSEVKHIHLDGVIDRNVWDTNGSPEWCTFEVRNPKDIVYSFAHFDSETGKYTYKYDGDLSEDNLAGNQQWSDIHEYPINYVVEYDRKRYISLQNGNVGNNPATASAYWDIESSIPYDLWVPGISYPQNKVIEHNGHRFINSIAGNTEEPIIDSERGINTDKVPDFKNKTGCGWINCTNTIKVKNYIIDMSRIMTKIKEKEDAYLEDTSAENLQEMKSTFETYFDVDNLVDYLIINDIINNADAFASNWQWLTYDGVKWWCGLYDCNISFGYGGGQYTTANFRAPLTNHVVGSSNYMMRYIKVYYKDELEARYSFLRRNKVITAEKIVYNIIIDWINAVGYVNYAKEREKWPSEGSVDNVFRIKKWVYENIDNLDVLYNYNQN